MRIPRIYQTCNLNAGEQIELDTAAAHHLSRVLRAASGDPVILFNGYGGEYRAELVIAGKKVSANIVEHIDVDRESHLHITLLQGISKGERMDFAIQKAVELGVNRIVPVICERTVVNLKQERGNKKLQHWQGIMVNACEQSGRTQLPLLDAPIKLDQLVSLDLSGLKLTLDPRSTIHIREIENNDTRIHLLIGPEGGLSNAEVEQTLGMGFVGVNLGPRILRTETAALATIAALQSQWGDF